MPAKPKKAKTHQAIRSGQAQEAKTPRGLVVYWPRLLYLIPVGLVLWVPFYNRADPPLAGIPFFYWYQLALILVGAAFVFIVYRLDTRVTGAIPGAGRKIDPGATGDVL
jgi:hypothetical protein